MAINIIIMGKNDLGVGCADILNNDQDFNILGIIGHEGDKPNDGWQRSMFKYAIDHDIKFIAPIKVRKSDLDTLTGEKELNYLFSFQYEKIIKKDVLNYPINGCINIHFSLLPRNRGMYTIAWAMLEGDERSGVTMHYMDLGIDTGDIISQRGFKIEEHLTAQDIYERCNIEGVELLKETVSELKSLKYIGHKQDDSKATYHPKGSLVFQNVAIDWNETAEEVHKKIKAFTFPQYQCPAAHLGSEKIFPSKILIVDKSIKGLLPGEFDSPPDKYGLLVSTKNKMILIEQFFENEKEIDAIELWKLKNFPPKGNFSTNFKTKNILNRDL